MIGIGVKDVSSRLINAYFQNRLGFSKEETILLQGEYFKSYGLIVEGLASNYQIDPLDFNSMVDDALPLDSLIKPNPELRQLLEEIDKEKFRLWLLSNAHITHVKRVVSSLLASRPLGGQSQSFFPFHTSLTPSPFNLKSPKDFSSSSCNGLLLTDISYKAMAPLQHDPNLSEDIQPLIEVDHEVLVAKMQAIVTAVSQLKAKKDCVINSTLNQMMRAAQIESCEVATIWADITCHRIVNDFNSGGIYDVLITTFATLRIPGPQLHGPCQRGFLLEIPDAV
ncbi:pyrimidine 5 nucleotidase [Fusarium phyllophilum]|uniref:Pyrimidine 5 nucleotidase n=1 Tax=Fusarium phyllophilum TaxID=47803 RepID=A0A8H5IGA9_9HYPO|nr:pyrimidine 5 nucleotidase [Fusarium phyllophilum]